MGNLNGLMEEYILENIKMIKKKEKENIIGLMEGNIKEIGKMGSNMEKDFFICHQKIFGKKEFGIMEKELNGLRKIITVNRIILFIFP